MPEWIVVRTPQGGHVADSRAPFDPVTTDALVRAARRVRPGPSRGSVKARSSIYVVLLELAPDDYGLYVGRTGLTPEERFRNHKAGHKASKSVQKYGIGLLPALYRHLNPISYEDAAVAELVLAEALRRVGGPGKAGLVALPTTLATHEPRAWDACGRRDDVGRRSLQR